MLTRRRFLGTTAAMAAAAGAPRLALAQGEPIRIGFLTVHTGALAAGGRQMEEGINLFLAERGQKLAGRPVELIVGDTAGNPAQTKTKTQELVERNNVHVLIGPLAAFEALAISDYVMQKEVPIISDSAAAEDLTQRKRNPWFVRAVGTSAQSNHPLGEYTAKKLGYKRVGTISDDFAYGHELTAGFQRTFEENGGKVVQKLWPPLNVADYGSFIAQVKPDLDALYIGFAGANGLRFLKQWAEYGMKGRIPLLGTMTSVDEGILKNMGEEAVGVISSGWYSAAIDTPTNKKFVEAIRREHKADPGYYTTGAYVAGRMLEEALKTVNGKIEDKKAFMAALHGVKVPDSPLGPVTLDEYGNPIMTIYIRKTERVNGRLMNTVIASYDKVSQFWKYDPKEFLANPVYSREWPPAKFIE
jgi:branched-chain amino acid transport system substrate-binding protein